MYLEFWKAISWLIKQLHQYYDWKCNVFIYVLWHFWTKNYPTQLTTRDDFALFQKSYYHLIWRESECILECDFLKFIIIIITIIIIISSSSSL